MFDDPELNEKWNLVRNRFRASMMMQTEIYKLAQNIDASWPLRGKEETPEKYISHPVEELAFFPEFKDKPDRLPLLISILEETLAFDDPFGEMVEYVDSSSKKDESAYKSLQKLGIPETFPIALTHLSADTKDFCQGESINDIKSFIVFSQNMAQNIVVGGDFKKLLNSLTHLDESSLQKYIPIRKAETGVYLAESMGLFAKGLSDEEKRHLLELFNLSFETSSVKQARSLGKTEKERLYAKIQDEMDLRHDSFKSEYAELKALMDKDQRQQERFFISLNNAELESIAWAIASLYYLGHPDSRKKGLLNRFFGR